MQWQIVMVSVMLLFGGAVGVAELRRRTKPEQQRIAECEQRYFTRAEPRVEVGGYEANLKSEPLARLALRHGYELERTEVRGAPAQLRAVKYHFVLRGPEAKPAPFLPESPDYASYMGWETARRRRVRRFYAAFYSALIALVGVLVMVALEVVP
jgi:hypothetical protein